MYVRSNLKLILTETPHYGFILFLPDSLLQVSKIFIDWVIFYATVLTKTYFHIPREIA